MNIARFNTLYANPEQRTQIRKALTSATNVGEALIPQHLETAITTTVLYLVPELQLVELAFDNQPSRITSSSHHCTSWLEKWM